MAKVKPRSSGSPKVYPSGQGHMVKGYTTWPSEMQPEARVTEGWTWPGSFRLNAEGVGREAKGRIHFFKDQEHLGDPVLALPLTVSPWAGHFACLSLGFLIFKENHTNIGYPKHVYTLEQLVVQF